MTTYAERAAGRPETRVLARMFAWVALGFATTLVVAAALAANGVVPAETGLVLAWVPALALLVVLGLWSSLPARLAEALYLLAAVLLGVGLSPAFWLLGPDVILAALAPVIAAFGGAAVAGLVVRRDLTTFGHVLTLALLGFLAAAAVGVAWAGPWLPFAGIALFTLLTVFDVWSVRAEARSARDEEDEARIAILGAVELYLNLLTLLLFVLQAILETVADGLGG